MPFSVLLFFRDHLHVYESLPIADYALIDDRHVLEFGDVIRLHNEHSASDLENVVYLERVQVALLTLSAQPQPCAIRRSHILKVEPLWSVDAAWLPRLRLVIGYLGMEVGHLRVVLHTEAIILVPSNPEAELINRDNAIASGSLEDVELHEALLGGVHDLEL